MQKASTTIEVQGTTWVKHAKLALAGAVIGILAVFGAAATSAPDAAAADEQAGATWSFTVGDEDDSPTKGGGQGGGTGGVAAYGATWS